MDLSRLFKPKSMAVVGVSLTNSRHPANVIYNKTYLRYPIRIYPVNPAGGFLQREKVYKRLSDVPEALDLVVVAARAEYVPEILEECIRIEAGGATIVSAGFSEVGRDDLQNRLVQAAESADFPFIGPNCLGIYSPGVIDTFFLPAERLVRPEAGRVALISQSGGVLVDQMVKFAGQGVGLSLGVSIGNKAVIRELDLLEYLVQDPGTDVIAFYVEGFRENEGRRFVQAAGGCGKPVIVLKAGKSSEGSKAASSHTASLAGDYPVFSSVLSQFGLAEAKNEYELVAFCESLSCYKKPIQGRIGIVTVSGGHGVLSVDACALHGLSIPAFPEALQQKMREKLSASIRTIASLSNPVDLTGSAVDDDFVAAIDTVSDFAEIDCIILLLLPYSPGITADLGARLSHVYQRKEKPLVAYVPHVEKFRMLIEGFELNRVPVSSSIEGAVLMAEAMRRYRPC